MSDLPLEVPKIGPYGNVRSLRQGRGVSTEFCDIFLNSSVGSEGGFNTGKVAIPRPWEKSIVCITFIHPANFRGVDLVAVRPAAPHPPRRRRGLCHAQRGCGVLACRGSPYPGAGSDRGHPLRHGTHLSHRRRGAVAPSGDPDTRRIRRVLCRDGRRSVPHSPRTCPPFPNAPRGIKRPLPAPWASMMRRRGNEDPSHGVFATGAIFALIGRICGIHLSACHTDFLPPAHEHMNLTGCVDMSIFGTWPKGSCHGAWCVWRASPRRRVPVWRKPKVTNRVRAATIGIRRANCEPCEF